MSSILFLLFFVPLLGIFLLVLNYFLAPKDTYVNKTVAFECGFSSKNSQSREKFNISWFLVGLLYLLFAMEIILVLPYSAATFSDLYSFWIIITFLVILILGFAYELGNKVINFAKLPIKTTNSSGDTRQSSI